MSHGGQGAGAPDLILLAPLDGWATPLAEVPDPVFADKMLGDGLAIDPTGSVLSAPCDGEVILLHAALHAVTLRAANGAEILMHVGLDTVALGGRGFTAHVSKGQKVKAGDPLLTFDLDQLANAARSLITPVIIANGEDFAIAERAENRSISRGEVLMRLRRLTPLPTAAAAAAREFRRDVVVPLAHGLHARPAARLAELAKGFASEIVLESEGRRANAKSPVAVMALGLSKNAPAAILAIGEDAERAVAALAALIESGMGETGSAAAPLSMPRYKAPAVAGMLTGVRAAPGLAAGRAMHLTLPDLAVEEAGQGIDYEWKCLEGARAFVRTKLAAATGRSAEQVAILGAHLAFLDDPELTAAAAGLIREEKSAAFAWRAVIQAQIAILKTVRDPRFAERIADLIDLERQVLVALGGIDTGQISLPPETILLADDLLPSQLAGLDSANLAGIAMAAGGPTSHAAILAASMNIPALVACGSALHAIIDGAPLLLDADRGTLTIDPPGEAWEKAKTLIAAAHAERAAAEARARLPCLTRDKVRIEIFANLGAVDEAAKAVAMGAEGCGLLRTEFLFLGRQSPPGEEEQAAVYRAIAQALDGRPLIVRTLDIGGDKPAAYLPFPPEENPALGLRGVRVSLWRPDLLHTQLRAILAAIPVAQCRIMVPMVASLAELRAVREMLDRAREELAIREKVALGVMVETPAAAVTADLLAAEADFLSIGTNDLTQYGLAMDRGNASLAAGFDALHPAVLRLIAATTEGAARWKRPVGVCGGLASDPLAARILIGLGVTSLSSTAGQIAGLKAAIANVTLEDCRALARKSLAATSAAEVRALALDLGEK